ncbi:MAG: RNA polymerase factor sigma-54 [Bryobacteraceae bacterium]|nr:RNA polymerase factor sigma-54 [Bryobacteraceae bacterium]MDW8379422.1 RNA polymerase factor sigma-54 [Bryobacterales bacterium]
MSLLSPKLQLKVAQKQILTPGLVQMVTVLQLNRQELREMIAAEMANNPFLEEGAEGEELTPQEVQALLEAERNPEPADQSITETIREAAQPDGIFALDAGELEGRDGSGASGLEGPDALETGLGADASAGDPVLALEEPGAGSQTTDSFEEIDFGSYFDDYLDPGFKSPAAESVEKPSFETFLSSPVTLASHLEQQLALMVLTDPVRAAADVIVGNLDENGYLNDRLEDLAALGNFQLEDLEAALKAVQSCDPAGVGARNPRECLLLQLESRNGKGGVAWQIVSDHMKLLETRQFKELAKVLGRPLEHIQIAVQVIRHLDPRPGLRYSGPAARQVEPDVYIYKDGDDYIIQISDEDLPQLRLNSQYRRLIDRDQEPSKEVRNYMRERYASALQLMKNIEQRKQTIFKVCQAIVNRQTEFLERGIDYLRPMMIKDVAEEIGVHASTVSRAVANKYAHTPQGVFELRFFFSEAVQGPSGGGTPLLILKRRVKKMIEEEDPAHPLTDEQITERLLAEGIQVTRRTVAKYREDMKIPSTHQRRRRE